jgi:hypothetical protein
VEEKEIKPRRKRFTEKKRNRKNHSKSLCDWRKIRKLTRPAVRHVEDIEEDVEEIELEFMYKRFGEIDED